MGAVAKDLTSWSPPIFKLSFGLIADIAIRVRHVRQSLKAVIRAVQRRLTNIPISMFRVSRAEDDA
jgi:hypothetical protein